MNDNGQLILERLDYNYPWYLYSSGQMTRVPGYGLAINNSGMVAGIDGGPNQVYTQGSGVETLLNGLPRAQEQLSGCHQ